MREQLRQLRDVMKGLGIHAYLIPTDDFHGSEYVGDHFKSRAYVSGFTGSAGTLLVTEDMAGLWTDGRYFIQAADQLRGSGITLFKMGEKGVPDIGTYLKDYLKEGMIFGFDGRCVMEDKAVAYRKIVEETGAKMETEMDIVNGIWEDRPEISCRPAWVLPEKYSGMSFSDKISTVRQEMDKKGADLFLLASLDDICWLLNVRGDDVAFTPVVMGYLTCTRDEVTWYVQEKALGAEIKKYLQANGILTKEYDQIYEDLSRLPSGTAVLYQPTRTNYALTSCLPEEVRRIRVNNPTEILKARKNFTEVENERIAHRKDGTALTRFMYYLKTHAVGEGETEVSLADRLLELRKEQENYVEDSFAPIIAYGDHGAIPHYSADEESDRRIEGKGFLLVDTGGHYLEGSTDTTRTFAMGPLTREEKEMYTSVLRGHINLSMARFKEGCSGVSLDILARTPLWDQGLDYNHGTGHGVGYLLNVHEGPNAFYYRPTAARRSETVLEEGMITSDEPGIYLEGRFGVRLENLIVCLKDPGDSSFLYFEPLTMVPFDREAILPELMTRKEIAWLNDYHEQVFRAVSPGMPPEEVEWLRKVTEKL